MKKQPTVSPHRFVEREKIVTCPNIDGKPLRVGIEHRYAPEGAPTTRIYCYGCERYFKNWSEILRYHKLKPKDQKKSIT